MLVWCALAATLSLEPRWRTLTPVWALIKQIVPLRNRSDDIALVSTEVTMGGLMGKFESLRGGAKDSRNYRGSRLDTSLVAHNLRAGQ